MLISMSVMMQIKGVPDDVHRVLKERAAREGVTLTELARRTLIEAARVPAWPEMRGELAALEPVGGREDGAAAVRAVRDEHE
jgi:plasmid stability protein